MTTITLSQQFDQMDAFERWNRSEEYSFTEIDITCDYCGKKFKTNYKHYGNRNQYCSKSCRDKAMVLQNRISYINKSHNKHGIGYIILHDPTPDDEYGNSAKFPQKAYIAKRDLDYWRSSGEIPVGMVLQNDRTGEKFITVRRSGSNHHKFIVLEKIA